MALPAKGVLVLGNEGQGISDAVARHCTLGISIPQYGTNTAESLNVGVATAILMHAVRRI